MSYELGARKPDRQAYLAALALFAETPERCLFIDDREANVLAAIEVGMKGIVFKDVRQLRAALARHGFDL
jgi:HAD superfamily hydrolase (TIGR01509 family)